ncbi:MAG: SPOR domain-containing protein [Burkholderiales bacterium]|nr:MAG: SPOR domain-containing protein [Burkholderiales bacterium]
MARRDAGDDGPLDPALTQKKRARRRLVGALVLGVVAAVVLPLVLDSEPRQTITDVQIEIPPRDAPLPPKADDAAAPPAGSPAAPAPPSSPAPAAPEGSPGAAGGSGPADTEPGAVPQATDAAKPVEPPKSAPSAKKPPPPAEAPRASPPASTQEAPAPATAARVDARFALQLGAFANAGSARAQADKARKAGVRAYTETVQTAQGARTRVRVGPFATREAADQARAKLKLIGVDSTVVAL